LLGLRPLDIVRAMLKVRSIALELTPRCNQQCTYCYNAWRGGAAAPGGELTTGEIRGLVDRVLAETELEQVTLTGGEPFVREDLFGIIDHVNGRGLGVAIISNGGLIDEAAAAALAARRVDYVQVTLAGPGPEIHDALCGKGSFDRTAAAVARLVAAGVAVGGSFLCTHENFASAGETLQRMHDLGVRHHFAFNRFNPSGAAAARVDELLPRRSEVLSALGEADRFAEAHALTVHCTMPVPQCMLDEHQYPRIGFGQCAVGTDRAEYAVDPGGRLKLCTLQRQTIGSLLETGLGELVAGGAAARFRAMVPPFCKPCPHRLECLGGCGAAAEWVFGRADELDPFLAQHVLADFATPRARRARQAKAECTSDSLGRGFGLDLRIDPWYDLVYHVLTHLPVDPRDASALYDEAYLRWSERQFAEHTGLAAGPPRTLVADAPLIASLYDASEQGFLLHAWPLLYDGVEQFLEAMGADFGQLTWPDEDRRRLAAAIGSATHPALADLFRTALWSELTAGYETIWRDRVLPRSQQYAGFFGEELHRLAEDLPGLGEPRWVLSHPLRAHGRLFPRAGGRPIIAVGVADAELGVAEFLPVIQGCHEYFLVRIQSRVPDAGPWTTLAGRRGYGAFWEPESAALALGARFFTGTRWEAAHRTWLRRLFPDAPPAETAASLAAGKTLSPTMAAVVDELAGR